MKLKSLICIKEKINILATVHYSDMYVYGRLAVFAPYLFMYSRALHFMTPKSHFL